MSPIVCMAWELPREMTALSPARSSQVASPLIKRDRSPEILWMLEPGDMGADCGTGP